MKMKEVAVVGERNCAITQKTFFKNINPVGKALKQVTVTRTRKTCLEI